MLKVVLVLLISATTITQAPADGTTPADNPTQSTVGIVQGQVTDPSGAAVIAANVTLQNSITNYKVTAKTDDTGSFKFQNIPFNNYRLTVEAVDFQNSEQTVDVHSAVPIQLTVQLAVKNLSAEVNVTADDTHMIEADRTGADTDLNSPLLLKSLGAAPSRGLQKMVESAPGVVADDNGRIHPRGSESNVQTVINGVPVTENMSAIFSTSIDPRTASHVEVLTGGIPAEFGDKLGAVVNVNTKSGLDMPISGSITGNVGSFVTGDVAADFGGHVNKFGWFTAFSGTTSHRYLDPPTIENFHNVGRTAGNLTTIDYNATSKDLLKATLIFGGANFEVPNRLEQEIAGQDQRQQQRNQSYFLSWQHLFSQTTVANFAVFYRTSSAKLNSNPESTPVVAFQDRTLTNWGFIGSYSYAGHGHTLKAGIQFTRTPTRETFWFYPTPPTFFPPIEDSQGNVFPNPVLAFSAANPFVFSDRRTGRTWSGYVQDRFSPFKNFTIDAGLRFDDYKLLVHKHEFSPRIGIAYLFPATQTVIRASYNRLFQPPPA